MAKWIKRIDDKGEYWIKGKSDVKSYIICLLVLALFVTGLLCVKVARDNHYLLQEIEMYEGQPDYNLPQD